MPNYQFGSSGIVFTDENFAKALRTEASATALNEAKEANPGVPEFKLRMQETYKERVEFLQSHEEVKSWALDELKWEARKRMRFAILMRSQPSSILPLIEESAENGFDFNEKRGNTEILLNLAVRSGALPITESLMRHGADVNARNNNGQTPLHIAANKSVPIDIVRCLIKAKANVNVKDNNGQTPLRIAVEKGERVDIVRELIEAGADVNIKDGDSTLRDIAEDLEDLPHNAPDDEKKRRAEIRAVIARAGGKHGGESCELRTAVEKGERIDIVRELIEAGADINMKDYSGRTLLDIATKLFEDAPDDEKKRREEIRAEIVKAGGKRGGESCE